MIIYLTLIIASRQKFWIWYIFTKDLFEWLLQQIMGSYIVSQHRKIGYQILEIIKG